MLFTVCVGYLSLIKPCQKYCSNWLCGKISGESWNGHQKEAKTNLSWILLTYKHAWLISPLKYSKCDVAGRPQSQLEMDCIFFLSFDGSWIIFSKAADIIRKETQIVKTVFQRLLNF